MKTAQMQRKRFIKPRKELFRPECYIYVELNSMLNISYYVLHKYVNVIKQVLRRLLTQRVFYQKNDDLYISGKYG